MYPAVLLVEREYDTNTRSRRPTPSLCLSHPPNLRGCSVHMTLPTDHVHSRRSHVSVNRSLTQLYETPMAEFMI